MTKARSCDHRQLIFHLVENLYAKLENLFRDLCGVVDQNNKAFLFSGILVLDTGSALAVHTCASPSSSASH